MTSLVLNSRRFVILVTKKGGSKNRQFFSDIIFEWPLLYNKKIKTF